MLEKWGIVKLSDVAKELGCDEDHLRTVLKREGVHVLRVSRNEWIVSLDAIRMALCSRSFMLEQVLDEKAGGQPCCIRGQISQTLYK